MSSNLIGTLSALLACGALICALFGLASLNHLRTAKRAATLLFVAFAFAALAALIGHLPDLPLRPIAIFVVAALAGAVLGARVPSNARATQVAWVGALAAGAVAAASVANATTSEGWERLGSWLSTALAAVAFIVCVSRITANRDTPKANVAVSLGLSIGGLAQIVAGLWASQALLLVSGGVVALAGFRLAEAMARATGSRLSSVLRGEAQASTAFGYSHVRQSDPEGAAMILGTSKNIVIIPGYGLALAQGQHGIKELHERFEKAGARVRVVVHPAAGIVPGHMNALLDEAGVPHTSLVESSQAAAVITGADVLVVGANDIVNSEAANTSTPLAGLEAVDLSAANSVWIIKRTLRPGQADVRNALFEAPKTTMIYGDAKKVLQSLVAKVNSSTH